MTGHLAIGRAAPGQYAETDAVLAHIEDELAWYWS
jgi:hypothetical protein